jgi:NitT/TauT family transport system substrate-binding protein
LILVAGGGYWWTISSGQDTREQSVSDAQVINVATNYWPGKFWINIAHTKGWFQEAGLNVQLTSTFDDYYGSLLDTIAGKTDINGFSLYDLMSFVADGEDLVFVMNTDNSGSSEALVVKDDIRTVDDLVGKRIAIADGYYTDYMLHILLEQNGLSEDDLVSVHTLQDENMATAFGEGTIDGFLSWEPRVSEALAHGAHVLWDASLIPGISPNGTVVRRAFMEERSEDLQTYVAVWHRTTEWMKTHESEWVEIISAEYGFPVEEVRKFLTCGTTKPPLLTPPVLHPYTVLPDACRTS